MKYELRKELIPSMTIEEQILTNRGIDISKVYRYLHLGDEDIYNPNRIPGIEAAVIELHRFLSFKERFTVGVIVDCDVDGYFSSAAMINFLESLGEDIDIRYYLHKGKDHGIAEFENYIIEDRIDLLIVPDAGSNEVDIHERLSNFEISVIVLDHHDYDYTAFSEAIIANSQHPLAPNHMLCGTAVVWKFIKLFSDKYKDEYKVYPEDYLDLVACASVADMMDLRELETAYLVQKGLQSENLKNPLLLYLFDKQSYALGDRVTPHGIGFYIAPLINAVARVGTLEEKDLIFKALLNSQAYTNIPEIKRGKQTGKLEYLVLQAARTIGNIKSRQDRIRDKMAKELESNIKGDERFIMLLLDKGEIDTNLSGLVANQIRAKHQKPVCLLTKVEEDGKVYYRGSARGEESKIEDFRKLCEETGCIDYASGHPSAFGLSIEKNSILNFKSIIDYKLENLPTEPVIKVDFIYNNDKFYEEDIIKIGQLDNYWGQGVEEALVCVENVYVSKQNMELKGVAKGRPTAFISLSNGVEICLGRMEEEDYNELTKTPKTFTIIGTCSVNTYGGEIKGNIKAKDFTYTENKVWIF